MDFFDVLNSRRTVRKYKIDIPPLEDVKKIIDAARIAPSATNAQMWHYTVVLNSEIKEQLRKAVIDKYDEISNWPEAKEFQNKLTLYKNYATFFADAPVVIAVFKTQRASMINELMQKRGISDIEIKRQRPDGSLLSIGASIENLSLAAHALGYGTCWLVAPLSAYNEMEQILQAEDDKELISLISLGVPADDKGTTPKKSLEEIMNIIE